MESALVLKVVFRLSLHLLLLGAVIHLLVRRPGAPGVLLVVGASLRVITLFLRFVFGFVMAQERKVAIPDTRRLRQIMDITGMVDLVSVLGSVSLYVGIFLLIRQYLRTVQNPPSAA